MILLLSILAGSTIAANVQYVDSFGRNKMVHLAGAAYSSNPQQCLTRRFDNATMRRQVTVACDLISDTCSGFTAVADADRAIVIAFRGSGNYTQITAEVIEAILNKKEPFVAGGKVCNYFNEAFNDLWRNGMKDDFLTLRAKYPGYDLWLTGHSLGASIASIAAAYIVHLGLYPSEKVKLMTFGQPRTGNVDYANIHDKLVPFSFRVVHNHDLVPHIPPHAFDWYHHHSNEIWYANDMTQPDYKTCQEQEDPKCSDSAFPFAPSDHNDYYNLPVSPWGENGCQ